MSTKRVTISIILLLGILVTLFSCKEKKHLVDVPWYLSLKDAAFDAYNVQDTLSKYEAINLKSVENERNYLSFLAELNYANENKEVGKKLIREAITIDTVQFCNSYMKPISKYLFSERFNQPYSIPNILIYDFEEFLLLSKNCDKYTQFTFPSSLKPEFKIDYLWFKHLLILDQWYRKPKRKMNADKQRAYDAYCQNTLNTLYLNKPIPEGEFFRSTLYVMLLHSDNCSWSYHWVKKYMEAYEKDAQLNRDLKHFLYRSNCRENPEIKILLSDYL